MSLKISELLKKKEKKVGRRWQRWIESAFHLAKQMEEKQITEERHLALREFPEHGGETFVVNIAISLNGDIQNMNRFISSALWFKEKSEGGLAWGRERERKRENAVINRWLHNVYRWNGDPYCTLQNFGSMSFIL